MIGQEPKCCHVLYIDILVIFTDIVLCKVLVLQNDLFKMITVVHLV